MRSYVLQDTLHLPMIGADNQPNTIRECAGAGGLVVVVLLMVLGESGQCVRLAGRRVSVHAGARLPGRHAWLRCWYASDRHLGAALTLTFAAALRLQPSASSLGSSQASGLALTVWNAFLGLALGNRLMPWLSTVAPASHSST